MYWTLLPASFCSVATLASQPPSVSWMTMTETATPARSVSHLPEQSVGNHSAPGYSALAAGGEGTRGGDGVRRVDVARARHRERPFDVGDRDEQIARDGVGRRRRIEDARDRASGRRRGHAAAAARDRRRDPRESKEPSCSHGPSTLAAPVPSAAVAKSRGETPGRRAALVTRRELGARVPRPRAKRPARDPPRVPASWARCVPVSTRYG